MSTDRKFTRQEQQKKRDEDKKQASRSLKEFLKIVRCNSAYKNISNGNLSPQTDYFDQAHFIKEIKKYTGTTPKELHKNKNDRFLQLSNTEQE